MSTSIGVVMDFFRPGIVEGAGAYARQHGINLDARWSVRGDWMPEQPGWDGVLAQFTDMRDAFARVMDLGLPVVHLGPGEGPWSVVADYEACGKSAAHALRANGVQRVCAIAGSANPVTCLSSSGFLETSEALGLEVHALAPLTGTHDASSAAAHLFEEMRGLAPRFGLFYAHAGVLFTLQELLFNEGLRIPEDVAIVTIDKDVQQTSEYAPIPLTAVVPDDWQQGYEAAGLLHSVLEGKTVGPTAKLIPPLRVQARRSTGALTVNDPVVLKALHLIQTQHGTPFGVDELVKAAAVSRRTLEVRFRKETGRSLHEHLTDTRMERARRLLAAGERTVSEIADDCGFSSVHYFCSAFKRRVGMTPGEWRTSHKSR